MITVGEKQLPVVEGRSRKWLVAFRFGAISLTSSVVDNIVFYLIFRAFGSILLAQVLARIVSVLFNYTIVRRAVFSSAERHRVLLPRYLSLVAVNTTVAYAGIRILTTISAIGVLPAKILTETILFVTNFLIQRHFVFV